MSFAGTIEWVIDQQGQLVPAVNGRRAFWAPQIGSQQLFDRAPYTLPHPQTKTPMSLELFMGGTRGDGKTDCLIQKFMKHVGRGWGKNWRGIIFRRTYKELENIKVVAEKWIQTLWPKSAEFLRSPTENKIRWSTGEELLFRHAASPKDYYNFHGENVQFLGLDELPTWPDDTIFRRLFSIVRARAFGIPTIVCATGNPAGPGNHWVKKRYGLKGIHPAGIGEVVWVKDHHNIYLPPRVAIHSKLWENKVLLHNDPQYVDNLRASASSEAEYEAWTRANWDVMFGGMFSDVWSSFHHVIPNFSHKLIPRGWKINRSYDHGFSAPFSVGWWAESDGEAIDVWDPYYENPDGSFGAYMYVGQVRGDLIRIAEWYGAKASTDLKDNDNVGLEMDPTRIAQGILAREHDMGIHERVRGGVADSEIHQHRQAETPYDLFKKVGVNWDLAVKGAGSRKNGWQAIRTRLKNGVPHPISGMREMPGIFFEERCRKTIELLPVTPRDEEDTDDIPAKGAFHLHDDINYRVTNRTREVVGGSRQQL